MPSAALVRHPDTPCAALRAIDASVVREGNELRVAYVLQGEIDRVRLPQPRAAGALWQHTCCELFVAQALPAYREYNFSPSGEWAAYSFASYRNGAAVEVPDPRIALRRGAGRLELTANIRAEPGRLRIGLSVVVEEEHISYWALRHAPGKPDFHHPDAFALQIE
jgi:TolB-like protein